jgi:hypothetical protein
MVYLYSIIILIYSPIKPVLSKRCVTRITIKDREITKGDLQREGSTTKKIK